jgi:arginine decarboxylase
MAVSGKELMSRTLQLADEARERISQIAGLSVLHPQISPGFAALDKTRLTVTVSGLGLTGFEAEEILDEKLGVVAEFASLQHLTFIISLGNEAVDIEQLVQGFTKLVEITPPSPQVRRGIDSNFVYFRQLSPREAFFANSEILPVEQVSDRICAEIVCPYPPGIPVIMPGEVITKPALEYLQHIQSLGGFITGCADSSLRSLKVVKK